MEHKEGLAEEGTSISGRSEVVATRPEMSASAAIAQAIATYVEYVNDDFYLDLPCTQVGNNPLIVENILRYCDEATIQKCTRVNHSWRNLSIARSYLRISDDERAEQLLQRIGNLESFTSLDLACVHYPRNLISYSPNLVSLVLREISFQRSTDVYDIIFNSFPCLKNLELWNITLEDQSIFPDFEITTPKLESLTVHDANTYKANIKLEYLDIGMDKSQQKLSAVINNYLPTVEVFFEDSEYLVDKENRHARNVLFVLFPNVLRLELSGKPLALIYDFVKKAGIHWPHLRSLRVFGASRGPSNCEEWRNVIVRMVLNLRDLEDVSFCNWETLFDAWAIGALLLLPKLKRLHLEKLRIPDKFYRMMTDRVEKVTVGQLLIED